MAAAGVYLAAVAAVLRTQDVSDTSAALILLLTVLAMAIYAGLAEALAGATASALVLDYYFEDPRHTWDLNGFEELLTILVFWVAASGAAWLSARLRLRTEEALTRQRELLRVNQELARRQEELLRQQEISESLLLNILPAQVAQELREKGAVTPRYYEDVTVLFTDFCRFSLATEKLAAEDLVTCLHDYFTDFDRIVSRYGLEKLKTIGDAYMCLAGLPVRNPANPVDTVLAAMEILQAVVEREAQQGLGGWRVRIGIHTGPVIAGVVGIRKFAFDVWGETVNCSSRMESSGVPDQINISERTYARVKDFFLCESRGRVPTKDRRDLEMYLVKGILPALRRVPGHPPPEFLRRYRAYFDRDPPEFPFLAPEASAALVRAELH